MELTNSIIRDLASWSLQAKSNKTSFANYKYGDMATPTHHILSVAAFCLTIAKWNHFIRPYGP